MHTWLSYTVENAEYSLDTVVDIERCMPSPSEVANDFTYIKKKNHYINIVASNPDQWKYGTS